MKHGESWSHALPFSCSLTDYLLPSKLRRHGLRVSLSLKTKERKKRKKIVLAFAACDVEWEQQTLGTAVAESRAVC